VEEGHQIRSIAENRLVAQAPAEDQLIWKGSWRKVKGFRDQEQSGGNEECVDWRERQVDGGEEQQTAVDCRLGDQQRPVDSAEGEELAIERMSVAGEEHGIGGEREVDSGVVEQEGREWVVELATVVEPGIIEGTGGDSVAGESVAEGIEGLTVEQSATTIEQEDYYDFRLGGSGQAFTGGPFGVIGRKLELNGGFGKEGWLIGLALQQTWQASHEPPTETQCTPAETLGSQGRSHYTHLSTPGTIVGSRTAQGYGQ